MKCCVDQLRPPHLADIPEPPINVRFGGKADISRTLNELFLNYIGPFPSAGLSRYDALS